MVSEHAWLIPGCPHFVGISSADHPPVDGKETVLVAELLSCRRHLTPHPGPPHLNHCLAALLNHVCLCDVFGLLGFFCLRGHFGQ